ncbi:nucleoside recognition domain-containing protein [Paenibacillus sp. NPDC058071]|uniref:nucleoside recognition domain-containing protein n=1 Tax=Paenibacillus sp. NPDC058071 TaxID=3346326 RepID=UPI0036DC3C97
MTRTVLLAIVSLLFVGSVIRQPDAAFQASLQGLSIWWNIVFPGLLPFLVLFELIAAFGLLHGVGVLLGPAMKKLFKLPGEAALPLVFGWLSGFGAGAEATAALRRKNRLTVSEGQRLLALSHMPNPLFMLVVIGAGFMQRPELGGYIGAVIWLSAVWTAVVSAVLRRRKGERGVASDLDGDNAHNKAAPLLARAAQAVAEAREKDGRGFGKVLGDAVASSVQKLMVVGGFMIFSAVVARLSLPLAQLVSPGGSLDFALPALLESHIGAYAAAIRQGAMASLPVNVSLVAAVLAWSGISAILLAGYSISGTGLRLFPFIRARILHALHAALFALLLWRPAQTLIGWLPAGAESSRTAMFNSQPMPLSPIIQVHRLPSFWPFSLTAALCAGAGLLLLLLPVFARMRLRNSVPPSRTP